MFLHFVIDSYYSLAVAKILKEISLDGEHLFIMMRRSGSSEQYSILSDLRKEVLAVSPSDQDLYRKVNDAWLKQFKKIFIHGLFHAGLIQLLIDKVSQKTLQRIYFIPYDSEVQLATRDISKGRYSNPNVMALRRVINWIILPGYRQIRADFFQTYSNSQCKFYELYPILAQPLQPKNKESFECSIKDKLSCPESPYQIIIGHSSSPKENHIETLHQIAPLAQYDVNIVLPMSYHVNSGYRRAVHDIATSIFGDKVVLWDKYVPPEEYKEKLKRIDAGIFNLREASGFGVISYLVMCGCKVYGNRVQLELGNMNMLVNEGCTLFEYEELKSNPVSLLNRLGEDVGMKNYRILSQAMYSRKLLLRNWRILLNF